MRRLVLLCLLVLPALGWAQERYRLGQTVEDFTLPTLNDSISFRLNAEPRDEVVSIIFLSPRCPYTAYYTARLHEMERQYGLIGVKWVYLVPAIKEDTLANVRRDLRQFLDKNPLDGTVLIDTAYGQAHRFGAFKTPMAYLLRWEDGGYVVRYFGAIDDSPQLPADIHENLVPEALDSLLVGEKPRIKTRNPIGCVIR